MEENKEIILSNNPLLFGEIDNKIVLDDLNNVIDDGNNNLYSKFKIYNQDKLNDLMKNTNKKKAFCMKKRDKLLNVNTPIMYRVNGKKEILGKNYDFIYLNNDIDIKQDDKTKEYISNDEDLKDLNCEDFMTLYCLNQIKELKQLYKDKKLTGDFNDLLLEYCPDCICFGETKYEKLYEKINKIKNLDDNKKKDILNGLEQLKQLPRYQQFKGCSNNNDVWIPNTQNMKGYTDGTDIYPSITLCANLLNISGNVVSKDGGEVKISTGTECNEYDKYTQDLDEHGFNNDGININTNEIYDERGFDKKGINKNTNTKYDNEGFDIDGKNKDGKTKSDLIIEQQQKNQPKQSNNNDNKNNKDNKDNDKDNDDNEENEDNEEGFFNKKNIIIISVSGIVLLIFIILLIVLLSKNKKNDK